MNDIKPFILKAIIITIFGGGCIMFFMGLAIPDLLLVILGLIWLCIGSYFIAKDWSNI